MSIKPFATYEDCLARFTIDNPGLLQPEKINERASDLVMNAIAHFPQHNEGAAVIIADKLLESFDPSPASETGIGIMEIANLIPDPAYCTQKTARIHDTFGILAQITPGRVAALVCNFAVNSLVVIEQATRQGAKELDVVLPAAVAHGEVYNDPGSHMPLGPWAVNRGTATALHRVLAANPTVRTAVTQNLSSRAQMYRAESRTQHAKMKRKSALLHTSHP